MTKLSNLHRVEVADILQSLPDIKPLRMSTDMAEKQDDLFLVALGFEERCLNIPEQLASSGRYRSSRAIFFEYATNKNDNELNRPRLMKSVHCFAEQIRPPLFCDLEEFSSELRDVLSEICAKSDPPRVSFDISACSSKCLIEALTVMLEFNLVLTIMYSEAATYHPTQEEYTSEPDKWTSDEKLGLARGVSSVTRSPDHPGSRRDVLPEAVIAFPTFKPERVKAILTDVDSSLLLKPENRVVWLLGTPHLPEDAWRTNIQKTINDIPESAPTFEVSTFDYKETLQILERVYHPFDCKYLVNIAPLGSKMQSLGVVLFWYMRPEVSIFFASPREYNATQYSESCKAVWCIEFGPLLQVRKLLDSVGELQVFD